jgi:hypothetical protein
LWKGSYAVAQKPPVKGEHYIYLDKIYKVLAVSSGTDEVILLDVATKKRFSVRYGIFIYSYTRVFRVGEIAKWLNRTARSIYRYEVRGQIKRAKLYPYGSRNVRFYTIEDALEIHELISGLHRGRPRKDGKIINNTLPDIGTLKKDLRERFGEWQKK